MNTLITGVAGSGKTAVGYELDRRGYDALNMDTFKGLCPWVDLSSGLSDPDIKRESAEDLLDKFDWLWDKLKLEELLGQTTNTFFCGSSGNQAKFYHLFG